MRLLPVLLLILLAGCAAPISEMKHVMKHGNPADYVVTLTTDPAQPKPNESTLLSIAIARADGSFVKLEEMHERLMHVMLIRDDLQHFAHIHAEDGGRIDRASNTFSIPHTFAAPGQYRVMIEFSDDGNVVAVPKDIVVQGDSVSVPLGTDFSREKTTEGYVLKLNKPDSLKPGVMVMLAVDVFKDGKQVADLENFLGEKMHLAVWQEGLKYFEHAHPTIMNDQIMFHVTFPSPGKYKLHPQFKHQGKVVTGEFLVQAS